MQLFGTMGQKFLPCPRTKGQRNKLKILPRDGTGQDSQNSGRDRPEQPKSGTGRGTKWDRAEKDVLKREKDVLKQEKDCLKQEKDVLKQKIWSGLFENFQLILSRDKGTLGRPIPWKP